MSRDSRTSTLPDLFFQQNHRRVFLRNVFSNRSQEKDHAMEVYEIKSQLVKSIGIFTFEGENSFHDPPLFCTSDEKKESHDIIDIIPTECAIESRKMG